MVGPAPAVDEISPVQSPGSLLLSSTLASHLPPPERAEVTVIVMLDGVRWQEVYSGVEAERAARAGMAPHEVVPAAQLMPNLHWLIHRRGAAVGAPGAGTISASGPNFVSLPGYMELFTGDPASAGCEDNECDRVGRPTLADDLVAGDSNDGDLDQVAVFSSWPAIGNAASQDPDRMVVSAGKAGTNHHELFASDPELEEGLSAGEAAPSRPGYGMYRPDRHTAALALRYLRRRRPRFLFLGLGDTDEHAHQDDYPAYLEALRRADEVVGEIAIHLAELSAAGTSTMLVVTTDHGRSHGFAEHGGKWPESARVWLVAAGDPVRARGRIVSPAPRSLADVTATLRAVMGLPRAGAPNRGTVLSELFVPTSAPLATR